MNSTLFVNKKIETSEILKLKNGKKIAAVIPARMASTRFPNKPMAKILNKEMIVWVMNGAASSQLVDQVIVATDHLDIANVVEKNGGVAVMTDSDLPSGSDRIWAAIKDKDFDIVVNVQGDEPLIEGAVIDAAILPLLNMESNPGSAIDMSTLAHEISYNELMSENAVKVVVDQNQVALYFSRLPIPYSKSSDQEKRKLLESIVHPEIQKKAKEEFIEAANKNTKVIIYECPLFFEAGLNKFGFKKIITVTSSQENILKRITQRDKITEIEAQKRINSQLSTEQKVSQSDIIIENNSSLEELSKKVTEIYNNLIAS